MRPAVLLACLLVLALPAAGVRAEDEAPPEAGHVARQAGLRALEAGRPEEAAAHFRRALRDHPHAVLLLEDLIAATQADPDVQAFWIHRYVAAIADKNGRYKPSKRMKAWVPTKAGPERDLARCRARAAQELARAAGKAKGTGAYTLVRAWQRLFDLVVDAAPPLRVAYGPELDEALQRRRVDTAAVLAALRKASSGIKDPAQRLRLGRALVGLAAQARQSVAGAENTDADPLLALGTGLVDDAQADLADAQMEPLTVEQLRAMTPEQVDAFNEVHTRVETPGRAISPEGRYEIRTPCGHGTLLTAAAQVDGIHNRLAAWFGTDPFKGKPGLILIHPEHADLEGENAPFWWAGGFQRGSVTVIRFALSDAMGMAGTLTHELTHRFDGVVHPAGTGWFKEGRAVWTQGAFSALDDKQLREFAPDVGRIRNAPWGYTTAAGIRRLVRGDPYDYRDNYTAGHALWTYLLTWETEDGKRPYAAPLATYMESLKARPSDHFLHFQKVFFDGREGRALNIEVFAQEFADFLGGMRSLTPPPWTGRYFSAAIRRAKAPMVMDGPTLVRSRERAEPEFGQDHVRRAAALLAANGHERAAVGLLEWAWTHDELDGEDADRLVMLLEGMDDGLAAAAARFERRRRCADAAPAADREAIAVLGIPALLEYIETLGEIARALHGEGRNKSAQWFLDEHDVLADAVGRPPLNLPDLHGIPADLIPNMGVPVDLAHGGWVETALSGFDRYRDRGRWFVTPEEHLVVGMREERTARKEHTEDFRTSFVRTTGRYLANVFVEMRIHLLTPHVRGAVVVGYRRGDRHVRLEFSAGARPDPRKPTQKMRKHASVSVRFEGLRPFDGVSGASRQATSAQLGKEGNDFTVALRVRGPHVDCWIDGNYIGSYADPTGLPLDGAVGFASRGGAFRVEQPRIQRLRARNRSRGGLLPEDHDLNAPKYPIGAGLLGYRLRGLDPGPEGTVVFWYPLGYDGGKEEFVGEAIAEERVAWKDARTHLANLHHEARIAIVLPERWPEVCRTVFEGAARSFVSETDVLLKHGESTRPGTPVDAAAWGVEPLILFVDPFGIVQCIGQSDDLSRAGAWRKWLELTRGW